MSQETQNTSTLCSICDINKSSYVCPRCNISYCSVACYRDSKHLSCSESFYKDQILATLSSKLNKNDNMDGQRSMEEILMRINANASESVASEELDSDDEGEEIEDDELSARLAGVSLDDADAVWQCLTSSERAEFEKLLQTGGITDLLPKHCPWWEKKSKLVEEVTPSDEKAGSSEVSPISSDSQVDTYHPIPCLIKDIPNFKDICKKIASPCLKFNTVNIIGAYVYTARCFNGEHLEWSSQAAYIAWGLSETLNNNHNFDNMLDAVTSISINMTQKEKATEEDLSTMKADTQCILTTHTYILAALSDMLSLFRAAVRHRPQTAKGPFSQRFPDGADNLLPRDKLKLTTKKLEFYLSWVLHDNHVLLS